MTDSLTVRVRAKGDGRLRAVGPSGALLPRYVGRGADGLPLAAGEPVPAQREGELLLPADPMLRRAVLDGDLEALPEAPEAPAPEAPAPEAAPEAPAPEAAPTTPSTPTEES